MIILSQSIATLDWATGPPLIQIKEHSCRTTSESLDHLVHLLAAFVLAVPVGWNRARAEQGAGIGTFPLVAMANCGFVQTGISVLGAGVVNQANTGQGVITVDFVGAARSSRKARPPPATLWRQASGPAGL
jgi:uncharacterized membrane protein YhiD involved in acid resistance